MTLDPLPPVSPEAPTLAVRAPEAADESFAEHLEDATDEEAPRPPPAKPQPQDALVNWAALLPTAQQPSPQQTSQPQPALTPDATAAAPTPISTAPAHVEAPQTLPTAPQTQPAAAPETTAPQQPESHCTATPAQSAAQPVSTETNAPAVQAQPAATRSVEADANAPAADKAAPQPTQAAEPAAEATPNEPAPQPQAPPALAIFTAPQPAAPRPQQQTQTDAHSTEEITPLRADRPDAPAKHLSPNAARQDQPQPQAQNLAAAQPNQTGPRESAPQQQAPAPAPPPIDTSATPPPAGVASAEAARTQSAPASAAPALRAASPAAQVAQQIVRRVENGATRFELRLDPPELGRVDVRLEMSRDHQVVAHITADDASALQQLVRSAREIEWALQSAGLELSQNGLSFDLADRGAAQSGDRETPRVGAAADPSANETPAAPARALMLERWRGARVDLTA